MLPVIFAIVLVYWSFRDIDFTETFKLLNELSAGKVLIFLVIFGFSHYLRALRWKYMLTEIKPEVSILNTFGATMIGYGVNCFVPRLGELYRPFFLGKWEDISRSSILGNTIIERIFDILALGVSVIISVWIYNGNLYTEFPWLKMTVYIVFSLIAISLVFVYLAYRNKQRFQYLMKMIFGRFSEKLSEKINYVSGMIIEGFITLKNWPDRVKVFLLTVAIMIVYGYNAYWGMLAVNMDSVKQVDFSMAWILMTISAFGIIIPTPGGLGSYHAISILVLTQLYGFGAEISAAFALFTHTITYFVFVLAMPVFLKLINSKRKNQGKQIETFVSVLKNNGEPA